jgi:hypothetical protein
MFQQIGDRYGEATTFHQLGFVAIRENDLLPGANLVEVSFLIDQAIGHRDTEKDLRDFLGICERLGRTEPQVGALLEEIAKSYQ